MRGKTHQGRYVLKNPQKYEGDATNVIFRSSWEKRFMVFLDNDPAIISWSSEEVVVPYFWALDGKMHRYFPDFMATMKTKDGIKRIMIEVKPYAQTIEPKRTKGKREKTFLLEVETWSKNDAKWKAARAVCETKGWHFMLVTEKLLFKDKVW